MPGKETNLFGKALADLLSEKRPDLRVFYDHGNPKKPNVGKIYGHVGERPAANTNLAEVDVMVANLENKILLLIEIEEEASLGPKKILGVLMAILLSEKFSFKKQEYSITPQSLFICAGKSNPKGKNARKIRDVIAPRVQNIAETNSKLRNIQYVLEATVEEVIQETMQASRSLLLV